MNKIASYLQEHVDGEVLFSNSIRRHFSTDASILEIAPTMVVYAAGTNDVRKTARFSWQLAEKGHTLPITARGYGADTMGAAIGKGAILNFPAHMNRLLELDTKQRLARVQPGMNFRAFQDVMHTHGLFLPAYPAGVENSTIGGAIANNSAGEKSLKYGSMQKWVDQLEVVLANGEVIQTGRINKRELSRRQGLTTLEGEIYRQIDGLISDNQDLITEQANARRVTQSNSGYNLADVKHKDGSFDLTPLIVGSQGTLGLITEAIVKLAPHQPATELLLAEFSDIASAHDALSELIPLEPSAIEMVDRQLLNFVQKNQPNLLKNLLDSKDTPATILLIEFDDASGRARHKKTKKASKILKRLAISYKNSNDFDEQQRFWNIRRATATIINHAAEGKSALPFIEDGIVPHEAFQQYLDGIYELLKKHHIDAAVWGHAGDANLHLQPLMDLSKLGDRQKIFKLMSDYYDLVISLGGSIAAQNNDGRLRAPFAVKQHGAEMTELFKQVKAAFDPHDMLNPNVKVNVDPKSLVAMLRKTYSTDRFSDYLPHS